MIALAWFFLITVDTPAVMRGAGAALGQGLKPSLSGRERSL